MRRKICCGALVAAVLLASTVSAPAQRGTRRRPPARPAPVCPDPARACPSVATFEPHDLRFRIRENAVIWESEDFYAVVLKSVRASGEYGCEGFVPEAERLAAQGLFPRRKVFASRCAEPGSISYTGTAEGQHFMAVYAGATRAEAARTLAAVRATGKFPGANLRRMRAAFNGT